MRMIVEIICNFQAFIHATKNCHDIRQIKQGGQVAHPCLSPLPQIPPPFPMLFIQKAGSRTTQKHTTSCKKRLFSITRAFGMGYAAGAVIKDSQAL
jgi:hypothetical protein